ncbi:hypothetical protein MHK12_06675 [Corynebacterium kefirresidentii]|uniref:hypothetical protein n=1 Tax=Corynebacterium TaxID=1716 RepID=UPI001EF29ACF|nr:hypothetical protein [Corynebacterium kefirresidentii]MCG7449327.1 hypothetical protein [Corynebacterium kefirresidentii]MCG7452432.1 hypothetical protein [Corynebacterium kefirresidentii]
MAFEVFDKRKSALGHAPSATLQKKGILSLNASAHALIDSADSVELLYDSDEKIIALRPSSEFHAYAFRVANKNTGQVIVSLTAFTEFYNIDTDVSRRLKPVADDGMLLLDLKTAVPIRGNRSKDKEKEG